MSRFLFQDSPVIPEAVSFEAVQWLVRLQSPDVTMHTHDACQQWRSESELHERAWQHIESFRSQLESFDSSLAARTLVHAANASGQQRRRAIKLLGGLLFAGGLGWVASRSTPAIPLLADHVTEPGERRTLELPDHSKIVLGSDTALNIRFNQHERLLVLVKGDILISTALDPKAKSYESARPFIVQTEEGRMRALGTRFEVRQRNTGSNLAVYEGAVEVRPRDADGARIVRAGERMRVARNIFYPTEALLDASSLETGMLVAREMPLQDFIVELNRYRRGHLSCDPAVAELKVSGIYPLKDTERVLDMLLRTMPLETYTLTKYWVRVRSKSEKKEISKNS